MLDFLLEIKKIYCRKPIAEFLYNCSVHRSKRVIQFAQKSKLKLIFNVPYSPQFNGIETLCAILKDRYKKSITDKKIAEKKFDI